MTPIYSFFLGKFEKHKLGFFKKNRDDVRSNDFIFAI